MSTVIKVDKLPEIIPVNEKMTLGEFYDTLASFDWNYMMNEPIKLELPDGTSRFDLQNCPHMGNKRRHVELKELALRRFDEGFAELYMRFERHAYKGEKKPEKPE